MRQFDRSSIDHASDIREEAEKTGISTVGETRPRWTTNYSWISRVCDSPQLAARSRIRGDMAVKRCMMSNTVTLTATDPL